jgi:hypothetical protein
MVRFAAEGVQSSLFEKNLQQKIRRIVLFLYFEWFRNMPRLRRNLTTNLARALKLIKARISVTRIRLDVNRLVLMARTRLLVRVEARSFH